MRSSEWKGLEALASLEIVTGFILEKKKSHQISQLLRGKMGTAQRIIYQLHIPLQERSHLGSHWQDYAEG